MEFITEYIVIGCYLAFLLAIGWAFRKFNSNVSDYFRNGCRGTWWLVGSSSFMAGISAYTFTGAAGVAYQAGWSVMIIYAANALGFLVNYLFFAARFRQLRATTAPELIKKRYNVFTEQFFSWFTIPMGILGTGMTLYSLAIFSSAIFGFQIEAIILVLGIIVLVYSVTGGSWAIMATDFIQCLIMFAMTLLVTGLCLYKIGGTMELFSLIETRGLNSEYSLINKPEQFNNSFTWTWAAAMFFRQAFIANTLQSAPRYFSVKDGREAKKAALLGMGLMLFGTFLWFIPPMTARLFYSTSVEAMKIAKPAESAFAVTCMNLLPPGMVGLMVVAMFAASMSSMDSGLNQNSAVLIKNILPALKKVFGWRDRTPEELLFVSRVFSTIFGICGIGCALFFATIQGLGQFELVLLVGALLYTPMTVPMFWGLFIKKVPSSAAIISTCGGFAVSLIAYFSEDIFGAKWVFQEQVFYVFLASSAFYFICMPFYKKSKAEYRSRVELFFKDMNRPVDFEKEVGKANDLSQLKVIGIFTFLIGVFIYGLAFIAKDFHGVICPVLVGSIMSIIGGVMFYIGSRNYEEQNSSETEDKKNIYNMEECTYES